MRICVMVSGGGTNLQAIIDSINDGRITGTEICLVYSNNPNAYAIERAKKAGIPYIVKSPKEFENREDFNKALLQILLDAAPDLVVLAGCLVVIQKEVVRAFPNRI
ncbi:MAG: phosphoribosylglycinamide formyltransferase, partial [Butyrivibrio sp.]|nr:phosphoribosylglycinamide formyltransferase [Butyrivibrio sp.]